LARSVQVSDEAYVLSSSVLQDAAEIEDVRTVPLDQAGTDTITAAPPAP
jgi:hypothetical protein